MKFTKKFGVVLVGTAILGTNVIGLPISAEQYIKTAQAAIDNIDQESPWDTTGDSYSISGIRQVNNAKIGVAFPVPNATFKNLKDSSTQSVEPTLISPSNVDVSSSIEGGEFKPTERGTYVLYYVLKDGDNELAKSETVEIKVTGSNYEFEFPANQYFDVKQGDNVTDRLYTFLPSETTSNFEFTLPMPNVLLSKTGAKANDQSVKLVVTNNSGDEVLSYTNGTSNPVIKTDYEDNVKVRTVVDANGNELTAFTIKTKQIGVYKVTYSYQEGEDASSLIETIYDVKTREASDFKPNDEKVRKLFATFEGTGAVTSAVVGNVVTMPSPKVTNRVNSEEEITFRTKMEVVFVDAKGVEFDLDGNQGKRTDISSDFKFTPNKNGFYRVYYKVFDAYGNSTIERSHAITNVSDTEAPKVYLVESYNKEDVNNEDFEFVDGTYILPTQVKETPHEIKNYNNEGEDKVKKFEGSIELPAIYAVDNFVEYSNLTLRRTVRLKSGTFANGLTSFDVETEWKRQNPGKEDEYGENKQVTIYLEKATEYTIEYSASDGNRTSYERDFTVTVKGSDLDDKLPTINDLKVGYTYTPGTEIVFARPTATDNLDTRFKVETRYYFGENATFASGSGEYDLSTVENAFKDKETFKVPFDNSIDARVDAKEDKDNYYIRTEGETQTLYIVTYTTDYANRFVKEENKKATVLVTRVNPSTSVNDVDAVEYVGISEKETNAIADNITAGSKIGYYDTKTNKLVNVHQHYEVQLPYVNFADKEDKNFSVNVYVSLVEKGKISGKTYTGSTISIATENAGKQTRLVNGGKFVPTKAGTYIVTYVARDAGGHIASVSFSMNSKDTEKPSILPQGYKETMEIGESQTFYQAVITDNGEKVNNPENVKMFMVDYGDNKPQGVNPTNDGFFPEDKTFTPTTIGEYRFKFSYEDKAGNVGESDIIKIIVQDTTKPTISLISSPNAIKFAENGKTTYSKLDKIEGSSEYESIILPNFTAEDNAGKEFITYSFSVKKDGTDILTEGKAGEGGTLSFKPGKAKSDYTVNANGTYEISYMATDKNGNVQTQVYNLAVGDVEKPVIIFNGKDSEKKQNQPSGSFELGKNGYYELKINTNLIVATDDSNEFASSNAMDYANEDYRFKRVTVYLSGPEGEVKAHSDENGIMTFRVSKVGNYTIRYSVTDRANNTESSSFNFEVKEKDGKTSFGTIFWSVTLSILALAGLGVALFFLLRDKNKKKPKKDKQNKDKDDDKVVV